MAALLVGMSVMAVLLGALMPHWTTLGQREKEQELIFRGNQYARAIGLFQRKFANTAPPSIDVLVEQRFLRKKYKDPMTDGEFQPIYANQATQAVTSPTGAARRGEQGSATSATPARQAVQSGVGTTGATGAGGIIGVTSKSTDASLRIYNGRSKYNEWAFVYVQTTQRLQGPGQGVQPGAGGGPGQNPFSPGGSQPSRPPVTQPGQRPFGQ